MSPPQELTQVIRTWAEVFMHRSMRDFRRFMEETGLTFAQMNVLMRLKHSRECGVSDIGAQMGVSNAAASQLVDRLVQMGYISREEDPNDRRAKRLRLTAAGESLLQRGIEMRAAWIENLADMLTPEQQEHVIAALNILTEAARRTMPPPRQTAEDREGKEN